MIKCISIKLYNPELFLGKNRHIIFPYENSNNMRLVFSRCAPAQRHLTWELKQNTCEPCNASTNDKNTHRNRLVKQKAPLMATYKAFMRPALEYASSIWSPHASSASINKLQIMQNTALRIAIGCRQDTHTYHICLTKHSHFPYSSTPHNTNRKCKIHHIPYTNFNTPRLKNNISNNGRYTTHIPT